MGLWELIMLNQLNHIIETNFLNFLNENKFERIDEMSSSLGALVIFKNLEFNIKFVIDRGIVNIEITKSGSSKYYEISILEDIYLNSEKFTLKGYKDVLKFLEKNYLWILGFFELKNFDSLYYNKLNQRAKKLFPKL